VGFTFSTDTKRIKEINGVTQKLEGLKRKRQKRAETLSLLEARKRKAEDALRQLHRYDTLMLHSLIDGMR
jgi:hypothetical protein